MAAAAAAAAAAADVRAPPQHAGCKLRLFNHSKAAICTLCSQRMPGVVRQGYQCSLCLIAVCRQCASVGKELAARLPRCRALQPRQPPLPGPGLPGDDTYVDPTYMVAVKGDEEEAATMATARPEPAAEEGGADEGGDAMYSRMFVGEAAAVEPDEGGMGGSDSEEYYESNSSDEGSSEEEDGGGGPLAGGGGLEPFPASGAPPEEPRSADPPADAAEFRARGKTGTLADWTRHGASFRARLHNSRKLTPAKLRALNAQPAELAKEFDMIPENRTNIMTMPKLSEEKNRYMNILPNNHSRVVLDRVGDDATTEYINANWMQGYGEGLADAYIACQGPLDTTAADFWRMAWQFHVGAVVMITNLVEQSGTVKCHRYWPEPGGTAT